MQMNGGSLTKLPKIFSGRSSDSDSLETGTFPRNDCRSGILPASSSIQRWARGGLAPPSRFSRHICKAPEACDDVTQGFALSSDKKDDNKNDDRSQSITINFRFRKRKNRINEGVDPAKG